MAALPHQPAIIHLATAGLAAGRDRVAGHFSLQAEADGIADVYRRLWAQGELA